MATHLFVIAAKRWKAIASGRLDTGPHISDTGNTTSGTPALKQHAFTCMSLMLWHRTLKGSIIIFNKKINKKASQDILISGPS